MNTLIVIALAVSLVEAKKLNKAYKYPQQANPRGVRGADYPARLPRNQNQVVQTKPTQTANAEPILPTIATVAVVPEESWDATVTEWISVVDPKQIQTETVTTTITMAKLNIVESETYQDSYTETEEFEPSFEFTFGIDDDYDYDDFQKWMNRK